MRISDSDCFQKSVDLHHSNVRVIEFRVLRPVRRARVARLTASAER